MRFRPRLRLAAAATVLWAPLLFASPSAAVTCTVSGSTVTLSLDPDDTLRITRTAGGDLDITTGLPIEETEPPALPVDCAGATVAGTTLIDVDGNAGHEWLQVDLANGPLPPIDVAFGDGEDALDIRGSAFDDTITVTNDTAAWSGDTTPDLTHSGTDVVALEGREGNDVLTVTTPSMLYAFLIGGAGDDTLIEGPSEGYLFGGAGDDVISAGDGDDYVSGDDFDTPHGDDVIFGGAGRDFLFGEGGNDVIDGEDGSDFIINGGDGDDILIGGAGNDSLSGDNGDDTIVPGAGNDSVQGGAGIDALDYSNAPGPLQVSLLTSRATGEGSDSISSIEKVIGSAHDDEMTGNTSANHLAGGDGDDTLIGVGAGDHLDGGSGSDILIGGPGTTCTSGETGVACNL